MKRGRDHVKDSRIPQARWRAFVGPSMVGFIATGMVAVVAMVDPNEPGHYPTCPFLTLTGYTCPGCGSMRAVHALAHGDVLGATAYNPLTVAAVPILVLIWLKWLRRAGSEIPRGEPAPALLIWSFATVVIAFWVGRNLSVGAALAP
jgi:hypothetical protein